MSFSTFGLSAATVGMATLAFAIAAPASAQEHYAQKHYAQTHYTHYAHTHYAHARYRHYARYGEGRQIIVHPQPPVQAHYGFGPAVVVGDVVGGTGQAVQAVFNGAGAIVGGILGGVFGGASAIFGYPHYAAATPAYAYGYGGPSYNYAAYGAPVRGAVQCGRRNRRSTLPVGQRRFGRDAARGLLSRSRLCLRAGNGRARVQLLERCAASAWMDSQCDLVAGSCVCFRRRIGR